MARDHERITGAVIQGTGELMAMLDSLKDMPVWVLEEAIRKIAKSVAEQAKQLAPEDPEPRDKRPDYVPLKKSVKVYYHKRRRIWVVRFAARHAAAQHERTEWQHASGQAKYLEVPLRAAKEEFLRDVGANVQEVLSAIASARRQATTTDERRLRRAVRKQISG